MAFAAFHRLFFAAYRKFRDKFFNIMYDGEKDKYRTRKRLYEIGRQLGKQFMQISRTTLVNLSYMDRIEPGFGGTLTIV